MRETLTMIGMVIGSGVRSLRCLVGAAMTTGLFYICSAWCLGSLSVFTSLMPSPNFHATGPESGSGYFLGSAESACLESTTLNQITGSRGSPGCSHGE